MLDPWVRLPLQHDGFGTFSLRFRVPDVPGVFKFVIDYKRQGYSYISMSLQVGPANAVGGLPMLQVGPMLWQCCLQRPGSAWVAGLGRRIEWLGGCVDLFRCCLPAPQKRAGLLFRLSTDGELPLLHLQVPVRPLHQSEHERFLPSAYPYYVSACSSMAAFFVLAFLLLYHK